ncbi:major facilitator superfamily domain-containing protein [Naematelia encephala]|uniref:Major facilitator superfamily domain-containing protein n=1 Tax=Naematelia encephala TaxID=71784 RepID=A0A1Y2BLT8_9TREE|nr:major facilitator superfamily domain-containing protein [Naematelia encephala]
MGMGKYQWFIFYLCGFGYFLDLCWAQAGGLVGSAIIQELGIGTDHAGDLSTAFNTGLTLGAFTWGLLVDIVGRRWCFNITCLIASVFGFLVATPSSYGAICFYYLLVGFGVGGNIPIDATITIEFLPKNHRWLLAALSTFQPLGTVFASIIAFCVIPSHSCGADLPSCNTGETPCCTKDSNIGWRYTMIILGGITFLIFLLRFVAFRFRESPKYLLSKGHDAKALDVLYSVAHFNQRPQPTLSIDDFRALEFEDDSIGSYNSDVPINGGQHEARPPAVREVLIGGFSQVFGHLRGLFKDKRNAYLFTVLGVAYIADFWSFSVVGYFLPLILRDKGVDAEQSTADTYRSYVWIYLPGVTATLVAARFMEIPRVGRKWSMVVSAGLMGVSLALYQLVDSIPANIAFNAMEYWFQSLYNALLYAYTPETFAAPFRGSACGMLSTLGRIASIIAPIASTHVYNGSHSPGVLWLGAGGAWISMFAIALLPGDTRGKQAF